jgi:hypothetical protein
MESKVGPCGIFLSSFRRRDGEEVVKRVPESGLRGLVIIVCILITISVVHPYPYDNVVTRWALTRQIVEERTLQIDPYSHLTSDRAFFEGHFYCDKAVLTSIIAVVPHIVVSAFGSVDSLPGRYVAERIVSGASLILLLCILARMLTRSGRPANVPLIALGLGSILLPYSTLLYGHVIAALFLFLCFHFQKEGKFALSDLFGALAAATEFPVLLPVLILLVYRKREYWSISRFFRFAGLLFLAMIPQLAHNWSAFGNPFTVGYSLETVSSFEGMEKGLFGFTVPSLKALYMLTFSPERGLFFYMPWALPALIGFFLRKRFLQVLKTDPLPLLIVSYILLFSAYYMPSGGWAFGPRHLIPVIPFLALGLSSFVSGNGKLRFVAAMLILPAVIQALAGTFGEIHLPVHPVDNPLPFPQWNISLKMLFDGHHSLWLFGTMGVIVLTAFSLALWLGTLRKCRFTWLGVTSVLLWLLLSFSADKDTGGRIDYYRGVLAEHREEWILAAEYFRVAAEDPSAPPIVGERAEYCSRRSME